MNTFFARSGMIATPVVLLTLAGLCLLTSLWVMRPRQAESSLVVYCAHDRDFAEELLRDFERETGIPIVVRYDSEATKSLGLVHLLLREQAAPRCDVFWNNEPLGTMELAEQGLLATYHSPHADQVPAAFRDANDRWCGFAARFRVFISNTRLGESLADGIPRGELDSPSIIAIAKPIFGTTLTHFSLLHEAWGEDRLKAWYREGRDAGWPVVPGNAAVKNLVAAGVCQLGLTDTDDFFAAKDHGTSVEMKPVMIGGRTICIPNTVAIIQGTRQRAAAERLVDFLLSPETELRLARSASRQVPLGPIDVRELPAAVAEMRSWVANASPFQKLLPHRRACLDWLADE